MIASRDHVIAALRNVFDPEFGMSVVDLGLIRAVQIDGGCVSIAMTLTTRGCPLGDALVQWAREAIGRVPGVEQVSVALTFEPPWSPDQISLTMRP
jgi:metal-sulfur cluster biosynthetic enzyme